MNPQNRHQKGAALAVGLILLVILTLLAITGMNTATVELTMAGNEQYRTRAFQAAETGIERAITTAVLNPVAASEVVSATFPDGDDDTTDDAFTATIVPRGSSTLTEGSSVTIFTAEHFEIASEGTSQRDASSTHTQGLYLIAPGEG